MTINRIVEGGTDNLDLATKVKKHLSENYLKNSVVNGVGICAGTNAKYAVLIYLQSDGTQAEEFVQGLPEYIENVPVNTEYVGRTKAF